MQKNKNAMPPKETIHVLSDRKTILLHEITTHTHTHTRNYLGDSDSQVWGYTKYYVVEVLEGKIMD